MAVVVLKPVATRGGGCSPCAMRPQNLAVETGIALVVVQIGESCGRPERLFAIPITHVVNVGPCEKNKARALHTRPMRSGAQLIHWHERKFRRCLSAAVRAARISRSRRVRDAGEGLAVVLR